MGVIAGLMSSAVAIGISVANLYLVLQVATGCLPARRRPVPPAWRPRISILIPAHDEEENISRVIESLKPQLRKADRILVVADNCTDRTATLAADANAEVLVRNDEFHKGKGYALHAGVGHLAKDPPEILVVIDADCVAAPGALDLLAGEAHRTERPVQGRYLMLASPERAEEQGLAEFSFLVKNRIRPLGLHRLGLACQLTGSGMAFPFSLLSQADLFHGHLVEDLKLGIELARLNAPPLFCDDAIITSEFPASRTGELSQRQRWEKGRLQIISSFSLMLLHLGTYLRPRLFLLVLDALIPPLALWATALMTYAVGMVILGVLGFVTWEPAVAGTNLIVFATAIAIAWLTQGRKSVKFAAGMASTPGMICQRLKSYRFLTRHGTNEWIRTDRTAGTTEET